jgi:transcriptional regulator with XRE-family HTH domain
METIGTRIKTAMIEKEWNQKILEAETGIDQHTISDIINGKISPRIAQLEIIAKKLDKQLIDFLPSNVLYIQHNTYADHASSIQNYHNTDIAAIQYLIDKNIEQALKIALLENKILASNKH